MKIRCLFLLFLLLQLPEIMASDLPPFYPPSLPLVPAGTSIAPADVEWNLSGGGVLKIAEWRRRRSLNGEWKFSGIERRSTPFLEETKGFEVPGFDDSGWDHIAVPLNWYRQYPDVYHRVECYNRAFYRHVFHISSAEINGGRVFLHFGFIGYEGTLWINGRKAGEHHGDFVPFLVDITDFIREGENQLTLRVYQDFGPSRGSVRKAVRTYGSQWNAGNIKGGVWGDVELRFEPAVRVAGMLLAPQLDTKTVRLDLTLENTTGKDVDIELSAVVVDGMKSNPNAEIGRTEVVSLTLPPGDSRHRLEVALRSPKYWRPEEPQLYFAGVWLAAKGQTVAARAERFGYREFSLREGKFHLNGERLYLFGENLSSVRFGGAGVSADSEYRLLYRELANFKARGYNIIRNAHMPLVEAALDIADEIGLMIYDEWSWSFTHEIDEPEFERRNLKELAAWFRRDANHPSVVMWSCGNEVRHAGNDAVRRQLDKQVDYLRRNDLQRRPVGSFSGSASWTTYGSEMLLTDFIDLHSYLGNSDESWTRWRPHLDRLYAGSLNTYRKVLPYIVWESVGFSWGGHYDPDFIPDDSARYAAYASRAGSWGKPDGVGHIGSLGLAAALDSSRGLDYGKRLYGHRIFEQIRQDGRIDGFAPWFQSPELDAATLWTQPFYPGLRRKGGLPPRNLFSGESFSAELWVANSTARELAGAVLSVSYLSASGELSKAVEFQVETLPAFSCPAMQVNVPVPPELGSGNCQLRLELQVAERIVARNYYPVFIADPQELRCQIPGGHTVALLDAGNAQDLTLTADVLKYLGIRMKIVHPEEEIPSNISLAVIPAGYQAVSSPAFSRERLLRWAERGGTLLILEQKAVFGSFFARTRLTDNGRALADLVHPSHPVFRGLTPENFDTWENPDNSGFVVRYALSPFLINALAARGAMLGAQGVDTAILEGILGKGRVFWSQLEATGLIGYDSVAATYMRNLFDYLLNSPPYEKLLPLTLPLESSLVADSTRLRLIDLARFGNGDSFAFPSGRRSANGIPFDINGGLALRGTSRPNLPQHITGIPLEDNFSRLFFMHTAVGGAGEAGCYRFHYEDGTRYDFPLRYGVNISDCRNPGYLSQALPGVALSGGDGGSVESCIAVWENPYPEKRLLCFDFLSANSPLQSSINFNPGESPAPILLAVTGEPANPNRIKIGRSWSGGHTRRNDSERGEVREVETELPGGIRGKARQVDLKQSESGASYVLVRFDANGVELENFRYLSFFIRTENSGEIEARLPSADWKIVLRQKISPGVSEWHKVRLDLEALGKKRLAGRPLRGEVLLVNTGGTPIRFQLFDLALE